MRAVDMVKRNATNQSIVVNDSDTCPGDSGSSADSVNINHYTT